MKINKSESQKSFNKFEIDYCQNILSKLMSHPLSEMFLISNSSSSDNQNLAKIKSKLLEGFYTSTQQFTRDVYKVFECAKTRNSEDTIENSVAEFFYRKALKYLYWIPKDKEDLWSILVERSCQKLQPLLTNYQHD
jgi:hypothetical protein